jgi:hypothetical protein
VAVAHTEQPVAYFNSGCWTELPCSYLTISSGVVRLHSFKPETMPATETKPLVSATA